MNTIYIINNVNSDFIESHCNVDEWVKIETDEIISNALFKHYKGKFPPNAKIYHEFISTSHEVTPISKDKASIERLHSLTGTFYVIEYPAMSALVSIIVAVVVAVAALAAAFLLAKKAAVPNSSARAGNTQNTSSNNELSNRTNKARPMERIPDIYGTLWATPDLLSTSLIIFINNQEIEYTLLCLGRGEYTIRNVRDGETNIAEVLGTSVEIYKPYTDIFIDKPYYQIGQTIDAEYMVMSMRSNSVNGQTVLAPNAGNYKGANDTYFIYPNIMQLSRNVEGSFNVGDKITISNASFTNSGTDFDFNGSYVIESLYNTQLSLANPAAVSASWDALSGIGGTSPATSAVINVYETSWLGPFILNSKDLEEIYCNVVGLSGLYKDSGKKQYAVNVQLEVEIFYLNTQLKPKGEAILEQFWVYGSEITKDIRAATYIYKLETPGPVQIRMRRLTNKDTAFEGSVVDEVKWRDLYGIKRYTKGEFGNVTIIKIRQVATAGALALKERKLNMLVTRNLPKRLADNQFSTELYPTNNVADELCAIALDPFIGGRTLDELDIENIYDTIDEVITYFGTEKAGEFSYTIDSTSLTFEETVSMVANAAFCRGYRRGNKIKLTFERENNESSLLFNHRNKLPDSEIRTINCGPTDDRDGVIFEYTSPDDDALLSIYIPEDRSYVQPQQYESVGIRSYIQAYLHAWRNFNKLKYQRTSIEFDGTDEGHLLLIGDRILVADNTTNKTQDGEIINQKGLTVYTSQRLKFETGKTYYGFFQLSDGTIQAIQVFEDLSNDVGNSMLLLIPPRIPFVYDKDGFTSTTYLISEEHPGDVDAFLITEIDSNIDFTTTLRCVNYDRRYYEKDKDYIKGLIIES